jgi:hypothetical protein
VAALLLAIAALIVVSLHMARPDPREPKARPGRGDLALYLRVIDKVHAGQPYYLAMTADMRANGYPLTPFPAVRPPELTVAMAALPDASARRLALQGLAALVLAAWAKRLIGERVPWAAGLAIMGALATGMVTAQIPSGYAFHEIWAGLLIALSLALHRPGRWRLSLACALAAVMLRETAAPFFLVMIFFAALERRWREALAWLAGLGLFAAALAAHALTLQHYVQAGDLASPGWVKFGGWGFVLQVMRWNAILFLSAKWAAGIAAPLALLGAALANGALGKRLGLTVGGYMFAFMLAGRPDNAYWGLMIAPLWPVAVVLAGWSLWRWAHRTRFRFAAAATT